MQNPHIPMSLVNQELNSPTHQAPGSQLGSPTFDTRLSANPFKQGDSKNITPKRPRGNRPMSSQNLTNMINILITPKNQGTFRSNTTYTSMLRNEQNKGLRTAKSFKTFMENMEATRIASESRLEDTVKLIKEHEEAFKALKKQQKKEKQNFQLKNPDDYLTLKKKEEHKKNEYTQNAAKNQKEKSFRIIRTTIKNIQYEHEHDVRKYIFDEKISQPHYRGSPKRDSPQNAERELHHLRSLVNINGLPNFKLDDINIPLNDIELDPATKFNIEQNRRLQEMMKLAYERKVAADEHNMMNKPHFYSEEDKKMAQIRKFKDKLESKNKKLDLKDINLNEMLTEVPDMFTNLGAATLKSKSKKSLMQRIKAQQPIDDFLRAQNIGLDLESAHGAIFMTTNYDKRNPTPAIKTEYRTESSFFPTQPRGRDSPNRSPRYKTPGSPYLRTKSKNSSSPNHTLISEPDSPNKIDKKTAREAIVEILERPDLRNDTNMGRAQQLFKTDKKGKHIRKENHDFEMREQYNMTLDTYGSPKKLNDVVADSRANFFMDKIHTNRPVTATGVHSEIMKSKLFYDVDFLAKKCDFMGRTNYELYHTVENQVNYIAAKLEKNEETLTGNEKLKLPDDVVKEAIESHGDINFLAGKDYFLSQAELKRLKDKANQNISVKVDQKKLEVYRDDKKEKIELDKKAKEKAEKIKVERMFIRTGKRLPPKPDDPQVIRKIMQNRKFLV